MSETRTARQQQLSSAADEEISNRKRQEKGKMLQIYGNKGLLRRALIGARSAHLSDLRRRLRWPPDAMSYEAAVRTDDGCVCVPIEFP